MYLSPTPKDMGKEELLEHWRETGMITDERVLDAFEAVPREAFVPEDLLHDTYSDMPLPIGGGQTISQPSTVMLMLQWLEVEPHHTVLEIGAGSGYNAALLSHLAKEVITVEYNPELAERARRKLRDLGIDNVTIIVGDGGEGHPDRAPYDRIIATCACPTIPAPWMEQLSEEGVILAPEGSEFSQTMVRVLEGRREELGGFRFVPLRGEYGF